MHRGQVGQDVLDLPPVKEAACADDAIRDLLLTEGLLQNAALIIRAEEHGEGLVGLLVSKERPFDFLADHLGLFLVILHGNEAHRRTADVPAPQRLRAAAGVVDDETVRRVEDGCGGAVVLLQLHHGGIGEEVLELGDVRYLRAAPAIDGLVVIAHDADIVRRGDERTQ